MRKVFYLLAMVFTLSACGAANVEDDTSERDISKENKQQNEIETISQVEKDIVLIDNDDLKITTKEVMHTRENVTDHIKLKIEVENKQNKTFDLLLKNYSVDGHDFPSTQLWISADDVEPNETIETLINGYEYDELTADEHVSGTIIYKSYDGARHEESFNEYINN